MSKAEATTAFERSKARLYNTRLDWGQYIAACADSDAAYAVLLQAAHEDGQ